MTRFSFFADIHLSENTPRNRTDDYPQSLCDKLSEIYRISKETGCAFVCCGGDIFDRYSVYSYKIVDHVISVLDSSGLKTYTCLGEHDLRGHNGGTFDKSTLGFVNKYCDSLSVVNAPVRACDEVMLYAKHEFQTMEEAKKTVIDQSVFNVLLCHELLYDKKMPFATTFTGDLDLPFGLVCSGDLHSGFSPHKVKNTWYCNPGAAARKTVAEIKRKPKMLIIDVEPGYDPVIREEIIPHIDGKNVFSIRLSDALIDTNTKMDIKDFKSGFDVLGGQRTDVYALFEEYRKEHPVDKDVMAYYHTLRDKIEKERKKDNDCL